MARTEIPIIVLHPETGEYVEDAEVTVALAAGGAAVVYNAATGSTPITQPLLSDAQGRVVGWLDRGAYNITISVPSFVDVVENYHSSPAANGDIDSAWIADNAITAAKIGANEVGASEIATDAVGSAEIVADAVGSAEIAAGAVGTSELASDSVDNTKLKDDASTDANRAVTTNHVRDSAITTAKIANSAVTAAKIGTGEVSPAKLDTIPSCRIWRSATDSVADGGSSDAGSPIIFNSAVYQYEGTFWAGGAPTRITFPITGIYLVTAHVQWDSNTTGVRIVNLRYGGTSTIARNRSEALNGLDQSISTVHQFVAASYIEVYCYQNSGGARTIQTEAQWSPIVTATWLGPV